MKGRFLDGRSLVSLSVAVGFLVLGGTGLLLYFLKHSNVTAAIHTSFGVVFLCVAGFHIRNNFKSLKLYSYKAGEKPRAFFNVGRGSAFAVPFKKELFIALVPAALLAVGMFYELPGFSIVYGWGNEIRSRQENKQESKRVYQSLETNVAGRGVTLEIEARKGKAFEYPMFAVWVEDLDGHYLQTLYVSKVIGTSLYLFGKEKPNGDWVPAVVRRPEGLPYWGHQRGIKAKDGYFLPDADTQVPDVVSGATPTEGFRLSTRTDEPITKFKLLLEVNQSFDWNDYYSKTRFPEDKIYSGGGQNGQPSVIYAATLDLSEPAMYHALNPVGHGHPGGQDGKLDPDLSGLTTALDIVDGVIAKIVR